MAASAAKVVVAVAEESSSEDEDLEKFKEAVWNTQAATMKDGEIKRTQSQRVTVSDHDHDGNELQVTPEFRAHVAKKLGNFLDSCISEIPAGTLCAELPNGGGDDDDDDEGFRLFKTSVPGQVVTEPPPPVRRRPAPSSSDTDSEMEMRLKEAAVSIKDLIPASSSAQSNIPSSSVTEVQHPETSINKKENGRAEEGNETRVRKKKRKKVHREEIEEAVELKTNESQGNQKEEEAHFRKKKKKKKANQGENEQVLRSLDTVSTSQNCQSNPVEDNAPPKEKRKKRKKRKAADGNTVVEVLN